MANTDFGILLKTMLDKSGINTELEQVQKIVNKYSVAIMPELQASQLRHQMKEITQDIADEINKALGTKLTGNDVFKAYENQAKQAEKAVKEEAKAIEAARKEQESLTNAMAKGREQAELSRQAEQKRQQMAQNNAINKALEQEYQERQKNIEAARKQAELDKQNALAFTKSASERLSSAISKYSYGDTSDANAMMKQMNRGLSNFGDLSNVQGNITQLSSTVDKIIADLKLSHEQSLQVLNEEIKAEQTLQSQKDAFNKKNINAIDYEIQKREEEAKAFSSMLQAQMQEQQKVQSEVNKIQLLFDNGHGDSAYGNRIKQVENDFVKYGLSVDEASQKTQTLRNILNGFKDTDGNFLPDDKLVAQANKLEAEFKAVKVSVDSAKLSYDKFLQPVSSDKASSLIIRINDFLTKNTAITKEAKEELLGFIRLLQNGNINLSDWNKFDTRLKEINQEMRVAGKLGKSLKQTLIDGAKSFAQWTLSSGAVMEVWNGFKQGIRNVKELDDSLVELNKVTDLTVEGLSKVTEESFELGEKLAKTGTKVLDSVTSFSRAGYNIEDSMKYAEEALKTTNISENLKDAGQAADSLVNIMKGFQDETPEFARKINDSVNQVSNTEAVDFDNLIDGATRLSAVADQAGMSFEQMLGTLTGAYEVLGNMEKVANGQITIFTRLQAIQMEGEEEVSTVAKLQDKFSNATNGAVNIVDKTTGQLRNVYDILDDLSDVWDTLDKNTQEALAFEAAGTRQKNVFLSMMQNWQGVEDAVKSAENSIGSADEENQAYLNSLSGKLEDLESALQHISKTLIDSNLLKFFVDLGTTGVKSVDALIESLSPLGTLLTIGSGIAGAKGLGLTNYVTQS